MFEEPWVQRLKYCAPKILLLIPRLRNISISSEKTATLRVIEAKYSLKTGV
jgi:hypothetical protein